MPTGVVSTEMLQMSRSIYNITMSQVILMPAKFSTETSLPSRISALWAEKRLFVISEVHELHSRAFSLSMSTAHAQNTP